MTQIPPTDAELDKMDRRVGAASPAPWESSVEGRDHESGSSFILIGGLHDTQSDMYVTHDGVPAPARDLDFIAHARQDVPRLIAEVRRLRALLKEGGV